MGQIAVVYLQLVDFVILGAVLQTLAGLRDVVLVVGRAQTALQLVPYQLHQCFECPFILLFQLFDLLLCLFLLLQDHIRDFLLIL